MKNSMFTFLFVTLLFSQAATAETKIGSINCNVITAEGSDLYVSAEVFGTRVDEEQTLISSADIQLSAYDRKTGKTIVRKEWFAVPYQSSGLAITFQNNKVSFTAFGDDVGAMSELKYDGKEIQLQCNGME